MWQYRSLSIIAQVCYITYGLSCNLTFSIVPNSFQTMLQSSFEVPKRGQENSLFGFFYDNSSFIHYFFLSSPMVTGTYRWKYHCKFLWGGLVTWQSGHAAILHPFLTNWQQCQACLISADSWGMLFTYVALCTIKNELTQSIQSK